VGAKEGGQISSLSFLQICIPTFNRAVHLDRLLGQVNQAVSNSCSSLEVGVFVSDNASTDSTLEVLQKWRSLMPAWKLVSQDSNIGMMANFQFLIENSASRYCWLVGDDDELADSFSLTEVLSALDSFSPGLMIFKPSCEPSPFDSSVLFEHAKSYVRHVTKEDPDFLRRHTWITANIFRRESFDLECADTHREGWYAHMYGIFRGLRKSKEGVLVWVGAGAHPSERPGGREENFPNTKLIRHEWFKYFKFLAFDFWQPKLWAYARSWHPGLKDLLKLYRSNAGHRLERSRARLNALKARNRAGHRH